MLLSLLYGSRTCGRLGNQGLGTRVIQIERGDAVLRAYVHTGDERRHARTHVGLTVHDHDAVGAATDGAKDAAWIMTLGGKAVDLDAGGLERHGNRFALISFHLNAVIGKYDSTPLAGSTQNGMFDNPGHGTTKPLSFIGYQQRLSYD